VSKESIQAALKQVKYPGFSRDIVSFGLVRSVEFAEGKATVGISVTTSDHTVPKRIRDDAETVLKAVEGVRDVEVNVTVAAPKAQSRPRGAEPAPMPGVKHVVAVASGKGGVGKSTFAVNVACALAKRLGPAGKRVGLLDCDIYGPSIPLMMGLEGRPTVEGESLLPMVGHEGVKVMSMGFLVDEETPVVWRGPMIMKTIQQFAQNVKWGELELLVVDLPPGTGDAQLSLAQTIPLGGAVVVTTPQKASTQVVRRGARMFEKVNVPLLGIAENMSYLENPDGSRLALFGEGGGEAAARELKAPFLGQIPLDPRIREGGDQGKPVVLERPDSAAAVAFASIAEALAEALDLR